MEHITINNKYLIFLENNNNCCNKTKSNNLKEKYALKNIKLIYMDNLSDIKSLNIDGKSLLYDDLDIPKYGELYILLETVPQNYALFFNYYSFHIYNYKLKYYTHNFLMYLAQSFGAKEITWNYYYKNITNTSLEISNKVSKDISLEGGLNNVDNSKNEITNNLTINYDNNGSEIYFQTLINKLNWVYNVLSEDDIKNINLNSDKINYILNKIFIERYLSNNPYFIYDFFLKNEFLIDFVRKRQSGMTSINQEILFNNSHKTIYEYYLEIGVDFFGSINSKYKKNSYELNIDKNIYNIKFYETEQLEKITINNIISEKTIKQIKKDIIEDFNIVKDYIFEHYNVVIKGTDIYGNILQKFKKYYSLNKDSINEIQIINFIKELLLSHNDDENFNFIRSTLTDDEIERYLNIIPHDFFRYICKKIFDSYMTSNMFYKLINDIRILTSKYDKDCRHIDIIFILESSYYDDNEEVNNILNNLDGYIEYKNIQSKMELDKMNQEYRNIDRIELINKPDGNNYANCAGIYIRNLNKIINKEPVFLNDELNRFIAKSGDSWIVTGTQWLDDIIKESVDQEKYFGGFHSSISKLTVLALSKWKEYDIKIVR